MPDVELLKIKPWHKRWWFIILAIFFGLIIIFSPFYIYQFIQIYKQIKSGTYVSPDLLLQEAPYDMAKLTDNLSPWLGTENAKVIIVEFGDFNCPRCLQSFPVVRELAEKYKAQIKFYWRNYPAVKENSLDLAKAAVCSHKQKKFWQFHDKLFQMAGQVSVNNLESIAQSIGLNVKSFKDCLDNELTMAQIRKDFYAAEDGEVRGTPTFFVNGYKIEGAVPLAMWEEIIVQFLKIYH